MHPVEIPSMRARTSINASDNVNWILPAVVSSTRTWLGYQR